MASPSLIAAADVDEPTRSRGPWLMALVLAAYLVPIWAFPLVPTQDGPLHLSNAVALREFGRPGSRARDFYELRGEPIPNWAAHASLLALLRVAPPPVADKILATACIAGLALGYRYFLEALGRGATGAWPLALLFAYNRNLLMGFYNYSLSMALFWVVLGFALRRRDRLGRSGVATLGALLTLLYFTHLAGFLLGLVSAAWVMATGGPGRLRRLGGVALAAAPGAAFVVHYLLSSGFFGARGAASGVVWLNMTGAPPVPDFNSIATMLASVDEQLFGPYSTGGPPIGLAALLAGMALVPVALLGTRPVAPPVDRGARRAVGLLGLAVALLYFVIPEHLGGHGGFLHARLAPLPPMLWLACYRGPATRPGRGLYWAAILTLLAANLALVLAHFREANRDLAEFTAAAGSVGEGRTIASFRDPTDRAAAYGPVDHTLHAAEYYCVSGGNVSLENYQATTNHFPLMYRAGLPRDYEGLAQPLRESADVILVWGSVARINTVLAQGYEEVRRVGRLRVFKRLSGKPVRP